MSLDHKREFILTFRYQTKGQDAEQKNNISLVFNDLKKVQNTKLYGVGPVDNRPSPDQLHHFVQQKNTEKSDTGHLTRDT